MLTTGEILKNKRVELKLTYTQVNSLTKISLEKIKALEKNSFNELPSFPFVKGMVQNYAKAVDLDPAKLIPILKRDYDKSQLKKILPTGVIEPLNRASLADWLQRPVVLAVVGLLLLAGLVGWSWWQIYQPPQLVIDAPKSGQTLFNPVQVVGRTDRDASLSLNGKTVNLEADGRFETEFSGPIGQNVLEFSATSRRQKYTVQTVEIIITQ
jgi:cytoskeletal protein RodZ